jgi:hypothetical protein
MERDEMSSVRLKPVVECPTLGDEWEELPIDPLSD